MTEEDLQPPTNIKEVGIHMFYLRRDLAELTKALSDAVSKFTDNAVPRKEFDDYKAETAGEITGLKQAQARRPWTSLILGSTFSAVFTALAIYALTSFLNK